ncbi:MAG: IPT/TIG domain-containing protein [Pseudomonadota bacterium]
MTVLAIFLLGGCSEGMTLKEVKPAAGVMAGAENVTIKGAGFKKGQGVIVYFGSERAPHAYIEGGDKVVVTTPPYDESTLVDVRVISDDGTERILRKAFMYQKTAKWSPLDAFGSKEKK